MVRLGEKASEMGGQSCPRLVSQDLLSTLGQSCVLPSWGRAAPSCCAVGGLVTVGHLGGHGADPGRMLE